MARSDVWKANTTYSVDQIVYPSQDNGFYYVCVEAGKTKNSNQGYSGSDSPLWTDSGLIEDGFLIWRPIPHDDNPSVTVWKSNFLYHLGDKVQPNAGLYEGLYSYILSSIIAEPIWPVQQGALIVDGTVTWQAKISTQFFIPKELSSDELYIEFHRLVDYLLENNTIALNDSLYKFKNRSKIQIEALENFIGEQGYEYIVNVLSLTKDQLETLTDYLNLIHFLKGTRKGLELVLSLLGIIAEIREWWEETPKGEPHTFSLDIDFNLGNVKRDTVKRLSEFVTHYVFPKLKAIVINFESEISSLQTYITGTSDQEFLIDSGETFTMNITTKAILETTIYAMTLLPAINVLSPLPNSVILLPGGKALSLP